MMGVDRGVAQREGGGASGASRRWRPVLWCIHGRILGDTAWNSAIPHHKTSDIVSMGLTFGIVGPWSVDTVRSSKDVYGFPLTTYPVIHRTRWPSSSSSLSDTFW